MKRALVLLCAFILILGLSNDGQIGNGNFVAPYSPFDSLDASPDDHGPTKATSWGELTTLARSPGISPPPFSQPAIPIVRRISKTLVSSHPGGAGGLPG